MKFIGLLEHNKRVIDLSHDSDNVYFTGEELHHSPTETEAVLHFIEHGGPVELAKKEPWSPIPSNESS